MKALLRNVAIKIGTLVLIGIKIYALKFVENETIQKIIDFAEILTLVGFVIFMFPFERIGLYLFEIEEHIANKSESNLVEKMRYRGLLFNNLSILIFVATIAIIIIGMSVLTTGDISSLAPKTDYSLGSKITSSLLLAFLVQIFFKAFKYLVRVAAYYNGKADALEFSKMRPELPFEKIIDMFTPAGYEITDLQGGGVMDVIKDKLK